MFRTSRKGWIGIEWGTQSLKLAQVERSRGELKFIASTVLSRNPAEVESGEAGPVAPAWSASDLRTALALNPSFSGTRVACVLPMHLTDLRPLTIPPGTPAERYAMVSNEISSALGTPEEEIEFDFWEPDGERAPASAESVMAMAVPHRIADEVARVLAQAGLDCEAIDGMPLAMSRAAGLAYGTEHVETIAVVDWGFASSTFCVVRGGIPIFSRHLRNCGLARLLAKTAQTLGLSHEDVTEVLARYGLPDGERSHGSVAEIQAVIGEALGPHLDEMVEELHRTILYVGSQHAGVALDRLCLLGDGAAVRNGGRILSQKLRLPVDAWRLPSKTGSEDDEASSSRFGVAVALSALAWSREYVTS